MADGTAFHATVCKALTSPVEMRREVNGSGDWTGAFVLIFPGGERVRVAGLTAEAGHGRRLHRRPGRAEGRLMATREALAELCWRRYRYTALYCGRSGTPDGIKVLLRELACEATGQPLADHAWVPFDPESGLGDAKVGERIAFRATARPYKRGDGSEDYHLTQLRHVAVIRGGGGG